MSSPSQPWTFLAEDGPLVDERRHPVVQILDPQVARARLDAVDPQDVPGRISATIDLVRACLVIDRFTAELRDVPRPWRPSSPSRPSTTARPHR